MRNFGSLAIGMVLFSALSFAQATFEVTGTPIPQNLLRQNYGSIPKGISAYDLSICNITDAKQSVVSSKIYQALSEANTSLEPIGKQIMLAAILRNQNHSVATILDVVLNSTTGVFSILGSSKYRLSSGFAAAAAVASLSGQQVLTGLKPVLSADELDKFESQVLEPALVLDGGSCVERTVFVNSINTKASKANAEPLSFHIH